MTSYFKTFKIIHTMFYTNCCPRNLTQDSLYNNLRTRKHPFCLPVKDNRNFINRVAYCIIRWPDKMSQDKMSRTKCRGQNVMWTKCHWTKCHGQNVADKMPRTKCSGQNVVDKMSWTKCHGQKAVDNMSWTKWHGQNVVVKMFWSILRTNFSEQILGGEWVYNVFKFYFLVSKPTPTIRSSIGRMNVM